MTFVEVWLLYYGKDDQVMRTMSHSFIHFIYLYLLFMPKNRFSPAYKKPVVGLAGPNGVKSEKLLFSWPHCVSNLLTGPPSLGLDYTVGEPVTFPATGVVDELSHSPVLMSVNEPLQKKQAVYECTVWHQLCTVYRTDNSVNCLMRYTHVVEVKDLLGNEVTAGTAVVPFGGGVWGACPQWRNPLGPQPYCCC